MNVRATCEGSWVLSRPDERGHLLHWFVPRGWLARYPPVRPEWVRVANYQRYCAALVLLRYALNRRRILAEAAGLSGLVVPRFKLGL